MNNENIEIKLSDLEFKVDNLAQELNKITKDLPSMFRILDEIKRNTQHIINN